MTTASDIDAAAALLREPLARVSELDDAALLALQAAIGLLGRAVSRHAAAAAGELARRSSRELGYAGLAQAGGHRTPAGLVQALTASPHPKPRAW